ncbi:MAG: ABC transporter permease [Candidatus Bathyarchaeia archaeon]|jgi:simple sugar transport system permease protein
MLNFLVIISAAIPSAIAILYPALGENFTELSGIYNIGLEGIMLISAAVGFIVAIYTQSLLFGLIGGVCTGVLVGLLLAFFALNLGADQIVFGLALIIMGPFLSSFIAGTGPPGLHSIGTLPSVNLGKGAYPFNYIFNQSILVYFGLALLFVIWYITSRTHFGLAMRATGEDPHVAASSGINVVLTRWICCIVGCAIAALGGVFVVFSLTGVWTDNITGGNGFIAIALLRVGGYRPQYVLLACIVYGFVDSLQITVQALRIFPYQFLAMFPYVIGIIALVIQGKFKIFPGPKSLGKPYVKGER